MASIHIASKPSEGVRVTEVEYGIVTITVLDLGSENTIFPRYAVRRTLNEYKETHQSDVTYGDDIHKTCNRALAFDTRNDYYYGNILAEAYKLAADYIDSSSYRNMTRR
jgi:hypothetical protein